MANLREQPGCPCLMLSENQGSNKLVLWSPLFGGTLLGSGGLVHAYGTAAALALEAAQPITLLLCDRILLTLEYGQLDLVRHRLVQAGFQVEPIHYGLDAELPVGTPPERMDELISLVNDLTSASALIEPLESAYVPIDQIP